MNFTESEILFLIFVWGSFSVIAFLLGGILKEQKEVSRKSQAAFDAAFFAATEAKSLSNIAAMTETIKTYQNQMAETQKDKVDDGFQEGGDLEEFMNNAAYFSSAMRKERQKRNQIIPGSEDGEIEETFNAEDLV